jgi:endonuclease-3
MEEHVIWKKVVFPAEHNSLSNKMKREARYAGVISFFKEHMPAPETELNYKSPYELLVAVILSAQCTDKRVNATTPLLFKKYPNEESLSKAKQLEVYELIKSISYPNNKAKHLIGMAVMLYEDFNGHVPSDIKDLQRLPGVGRKTANVIASVVYNLPAMAVDTHVFRVSNRIGLTKGSKNPLQTEKELVKHISKDLIPKAHHWLILHGRYTCVARKPKCAECGIKTFCDYYRKNHLSD